MTDLCPPDRQPLERFIGLSLDQLLAPEIGPEQRLLALAQSAAAEVPAYRDYLQQRGVAPQDIASLIDVLNLPLMGKADYMQHYPLPQRCWGGSLAGADRVAVSSGSTGKPTFWPRSANYELEVAVRFEQVFRDSFQAHTKSTLAVVCFALGNWVGGLFTTSCCWHLAQKGYPLMVATPGNNKAEILRAVRELAPQFEQTVLLGYPPFVKDVIDTGMAEGLDWSAFHPKLVFAGEVFSEEWRDLLGSRIGSSRPCFDSASLYGTADGGVLGNETPLSIAVRRWFALHPQAASDLFGESRLPTLVQYDPHSRYFETVDGTLAVSGDNSVPLVRYHIADKGGVIEYDALWAFLAQHGIANLQQLGLPADYQPRRLPFVFVFGRADFTVSFYGANIYPENVTVGLEQTELMQWLSGKFVLQALEDGQGDKYLSIAVELLPNVVAPGDLPQHIAASVRQQLLRLNSEFANYTPTEKQTPCVTLHAFGDGEYFPLGVKHRYTRKS